MTVLADYPLMAGSNETLLRPGPLFARLSAVRRRRLASTFLDLFQRLRIAHRVGPASGAPLRDLIAWSATGEDIEHGVEVWRRELHKALGAGRSPARMGQGRPASSLPVGPGRGVSQGVQTPYTQTAVPSLKESRI